MILFSLSELSMEPTWITLQGTHPKLQDNLHYLTILFPSFFSFDSPTYFFKTIVFSLLKSRHCCSFLLHCYCSLDKKTRHKRSTEYCLFMDALTLSEQPSLQALSCLIDPYASPGWSNGKLLYTTFTDQTCYPFLGNDIQTSFSLLIRFLGSGGRGVMNLLSSPF